MRVRFKETLLLIALLAVSALGGGCRDESDKDAAWQQPVGKTKLDKKQPVAKQGDFPLCHCPAGVYGSLRIGMNKAEVAANLPEGISFEDFVGPVRYKKGVIDKYYNVFPVDKLPIVDTCDSLKGVGATMQLAFVDDRLAGVSIGVPPEYLSTEVNSEIVRALKRYFSTTEGSLPEGAKPDPLAKERLIWAVEGSDDCIAEAGIADISYNVKDYLITRIQSKKYFSYPDGKEGDEYTQDPTETTFLKAYPSFINGFEDLEFGMTEKEAKKHLPWGLTAEDLPKTMAAKDGSLKFIYGDKIHASRWDILSNFYPFDEDYLEVALGFTAKGLEFISIRFFTSLAHDKSIAAMKDYMRKNYGEGMYYSYESGATHEMWVIERHNGFVEISNPLSPFLGNLSFYVLTDNGMDVYSRMDNISSEEKFVPGKKA
jgi:hypothetical protein